MRRLGRRARARELDQAENRRRDRAELRHIAKVRKSLEDAGCRIPREGFRLIPRVVWLMVWTILADPTGRAARIFLRRESNKIRVGCIRLAALAVNEHGQARFQWSDERARRIVALGLAMCALEVPTRRHGRWSGLIRGIPRGAWLALLAPPWELGRRPSLSGLVGTHVRGATLESGQVGYLRALELAGFCYAQQLPTSQVQPFERCWPSGYATNRYWLVTSVPTAPLDDEQKLALFALHEAGWRAPTERVVRMPRRSALRRTEARAGPS